MTFLIRASVRSHIHTLVRVCLAALLTSTAFGWSVGHNDSAWLAATISPEPFKSNPALCQFAGYPDAMQDHV
jgi:hypothetical protein